MGQVLAKLDTSKLEATITQCKASLESARAKVLQARATVTETASQARPVPKNEGAEQRQGARPGRHRRG